jgi:L-rhamnose mutarotase
MSGQFIFSDNYFEIIYFRVNIKLYYSDIAEIRRETYEESHPISWLVPYTHISQTNLNQYAIIMKSGKKYIFRVSKNEERH